MFINLFVKDCIEIFFYSTIFYIFCTWLKTDKTKNILPFFLSYCTLSLCAWMTNFPTLTTFLFSYAPVALLLFIILHEKTLQRNLVTLRALTPTQQKPHDWLDVIMSSCLTIINANKSITLAIERHNALQDFITTPFFINAIISKEILDIVLTSNFYDEYKMVWINTHGQLYGINATWHVQHNNVHTKLYNYKADALFYSLQTDVIIVHLNCITREFTLISQGQETNHLSAHNLRMLIKKQLSSSSSNSIRKKTNDSSFIKKSLSE